MAKEPETSVVPVTVAPAAVKPMDVEDRFGFTRTEIVLGPDAAYTIDGKTVMAFGPGAIRLGREAGVCIIKPAMIKVGEHVHPNPHVEYDEKGQPRVVHMVKHGIMIDRSGSIRYVAPMYERIDIAAYIGERATKTKHGKKCPPVDARYCTREMAEEWNKRAKEPGDAVWWFVATIGTDTGIAFNLNSTEKGIKNLVGEILHFRKSILRRFETATDRRVIWSLVYESMIAKSADIEEIKPYADSDWTVSRVKSATFVVDKPTRGGLELGLLQELGIAIREDNAAKRENLLEAFRNVTGFGDVRVVEQAAAGDVPEPQTVEGEIEDVTGEIPALEPMPAKGKMGERRAYLKDLIPKLDEKEGIRLLEVLGLDPGAPGDEEAILNALTKDNAAAVARLVRQFIAEREDVLRRAMGPDQMKAYLLEEMAEGAVGRIEGLMQEFGVAKDASLDMVPDETIVKIYDAYIAGPGPTVGGGTDEA